ncbi:gluconate kinase, SKI family [Methylobacterium sp. ap11]|uniref:gluconokinase n=1 Tax=Methylobacterium sp. ap11 TaxID=1761799 RepID=UPI0008B8CB55|nr:gluconokinase [Methylobacterium sp. ap11]SEP12195.1 gluconate kinase, SKI family [Methylobacterium sp. ap11]
MDNAPGNPIPPAVIVVMGVSGSGKSTVASLLAGRLGWEFEDGDDFHPAANVEKMQAGHPLTDEDRWPWLAAIAAWIDRVQAEGRHGVVTCSGLKRAYRDVLVGGRPDVRLVYLQGDRELIGRRMAARHGHFMPTSLLDSQFRTLEEPAPDEDPLVVSVGATPQAIVAEIVETLKGPGPRTA